MKNLDTDKIIGVGLIVALILIILADFIIAMFNGQVRSTELSGNIVSGLVGFIGRDLLNRKEDLK